jgi:anhydro-N-acetylmuramic acid kinase
MIEVAAELPAELAAGRPIWALGLMSGTSMDGVDAALILTDGEAVEAFGPSETFLYRDDEVPFLRAVAAEWRHYRPAVDEDAVAELAAAGTEVLRVHAEASVALMAGAARRSDPPLPAVVGFHGQTVAHLPEEGWTWQLGDGAALARVLNRPVLWDFRSEDMAAGGEGAPLAPFYHFALAKHIGAAAPVAFLNIGGVANVTWVDPAKPAPEAEGALVAFDTGPGNALVNDWMRARIGEPMDSGGAAAAVGRVHRDRLGSNSARAFLDRRPPKSLDRNEFRGVLAAMEGLTTNDGAATLTAFTADCVADALRHMPAPPSRWLVCGGGRRNFTLMRMLAARLEAPVEPVEAAGLDGDMLEAQAFAYLAVRVLRGLPTSAPATTGCRSPVCGGRVSMP